MNKNSNLRPKRGGARKNSHVYSMDRNTILELKADINHDIERNSYRIYSSVKSLAEYAMKCFLRENGEDSLSIGIQDIMIKLTNEYAVDYNFNAFRELVRKRNYREHDPESASRFVDHRSVKEAIMVYNDLIDALNVDENGKLSVFKISEDNFYSSFNVGRTNLANNAQFSNELSEAKRDIPRLKSKLIQLENDLETAAKDKYVLRSEILATKNHIKMNEKRLLAIFPTDEPLLRKPIRSEIDYMEHFVTLNETDYGFRIVNFMDYGLKKSKYVPIYSLVESFLEKGDKYKPSKFISRFQVELGINLNLARVIRYEFIILLLLKNQCTDNELEINLLDTTVTEFDCAFEDIVQFCKSTATIIGCEFIEPHLKYCKNGIKVSLEFQTHDVVSTRDILSVKPKIHPIRTRSSDPIFRTDETSKENLGMLLEYLFNVDCFLPGQADTIISILNSNKSNMVVMPTGGGKSLIYYMISYLSIKPVIIVSPTAILINDQMRNLKEKHGIDNCVRLDENRDYSSFEFTHKLNYVMPEIFMNRSFSDRMAQFSSSSEIGKIIIDEIHCASNWSHDFRPAYLMLSTYILQHMSNVKVHGFTATTSVLITNDICRQFNIESSEIFEPIILKRNDISLSFFQYGSPHEIPMALREFLEKSNERSLIFAQNPITARDIYNEISSSDKFNADIFYEFSTDIYEDFVRGYTDVLVTGGELSIGVDLPNVNRSYHVGYPLSRNHLIQEAGRVARGDADGEAILKVQSLDVIDHVEKKLIDYNTPVTEVVEIIRSLEKDPSDIIHSLNSILGHIEPPEDSYNNMLTLYQEIKSENGEVIISHQQTTETSTRSYRSNMQMQLYLIFLQRLGIIKKWFIAGETDSRTMYRLFLGVSSDNVREVKSSTLEYLRIMRADRETIYKIKDALNVEEIIGVYLHWYYNVYLHHQREQYLNMIHLITNHLRKNTENKQGLDIDFSLSIDKIHDVRGYIENTEIIELLSSNCKLKTYDRRPLENLIEERYDIKLDVALLYLDAICDMDSFASRFNRIINNAPTDEISVIEKSLNTLYRLSGSNVKFLILDYLYCAGIDIDALDTTVNQDAGYHMLMIKIINERIRSN